MWDNIVLFSIRWCMCDHAVLCVAHSSTRTHTRARARTHALHGHIFAQKMSTLAIKHSITSRKRRLPELIRLVRIILHRIRRRPQLHSFSPTDSLLLSPDKPARDGQQLYFAPPSACISIDIDRQSQASVQTPSPLIGRSAWQLDSDWPNGAPLTAKAGTAPCPVGVCPDVTAQPLRGKQSVPHSVSVFKKLKISKVGQKADLWSQDTENAMALLGKNRFVIVYYVCYYYLLDIQEQ